MINKTAAKFFQRTSGPCLIKREEQLSDPGSGGVVVVEEVVVRVVGVDRRRSVDVGVFVFLAWWARSLLLEEERRSGLDPLVGVRSAGQADVRDHLQPLGAGVQRQPDVLVRPGDAGGGVLGSKTGSRELHTQRGQSIDQSIIRSAFIYKALIQRCLDGVCTIKEKTSQSLQNRMNSK